LIASDSWPKLEADFRQLSESEGDLHATRFGDSWRLTGAPGEKAVRLHFEDRFESLARLAGIRAGLPNRSHALDGWLNLVREECPPLTTYRGYVIDRVCLASAETCQKLDRREIELETIAASSGPYGLRRDMYPRPTVLYDHSHEPLDDADTELAYWNRHVWDGFRKRVEGFKTINEGRQSKGEPLWGDREDQLEVTVVGLCYDLAVLQANHSLDMGLRGDQALRAFRNEEVPLAGKVESAWLAAREALELPAEEEPLNLAVPFRRVSEHLRYLLGKMRPGTRVGALSPIKYPGLIDNSGSPWAEIHARFLGGAQGHPNVYAHWESKQDLWTLRELPTDDAEKSIDPQAEYLFKEIARDAISLLGDSAPGGPSWQVWLDRMRKEKRGFERIWQMRHWRGGQDWDAYEESRVIPPDAIWTDSGNIKHVFEQSAEFCADLHSREQRTKVTQAHDLPSQGSAVNVTPFQGIVMDEPTHLPELPPKFQNAFEAAKAKAELEYATRAERSPYHHSDLAESIHRIKFPQDVFFAFCTQARNACRAGNMTVVQAREVTGAALPLICDFYFDRDHERGSDEAKSLFRVSFTRVVTDDPQWKRHLSELVTLAESPSNPSPGDDGEDPGAAKGDDAPRAPDRLKLQAPAHPANRESPPPGRHDMARPRRLQSAISSPSAARRMEAYLESNPMKRTAFAVQAQTTDRTLRSFRKTGKVRRDIFENIARAMGITPEALLNPE
jgi:hypothetical protein